MDKKKKILMFKNLKIKIPRVKDEYEKFKTP